MPKKNKKSSTPREQKVAGALCLAYANTGVTRRDDRCRDGIAPPKVPLVRYSELVRWTVKVDALPNDVGQRLLQVATERPEDARAAVDRARRLRSAIGGLFTRRVLKEPQRPEDLNTVTDFLQLRLPVATDDGFRWAWSSEEDDLDRPLWPIAQSAADLLVSVDLDRIRRCVTRNCHQLFVGGNYRRYWCDTNTCGSRNKNKRNQKRYR